MSSLNLPSISIFNSLERQTLKQRAQVSFVPSRHELRQQTLGDTLLQGRADKICAWTYLKATGEPARRPFMPEKSSYRACQSWEKDRKWSKSAATSYILLFIHPVIHTSCYLARISRSEMRMITTCPRTKSPHESQLFYGSTTEFNGCDAAEISTDP